ncbi:MAG: UDP-2,4-diacetamido-2,4,6-trideoxy-beta-L-altropyranose hydrolase [Butyrivibrio sp.]|uniref:UDP-2,4-diacetamido-2,4, 6-trideoxy-beta-L-altropyranose hydrolase n=1 Tax=Butyrivibrio sp. TaxID=28121 RepID=UPI001B5F9D44|nr:UDP-2,4-diacetamido-2,4,6-trideoxy-beta-L-altropyranose hydrolase [Butyrivibrio sp.]MBP3783453.1 UDP-2,4-diacetamido-2,4,6-trideoxy-beta-L-altropyranose hydrolase [Butyrivibrio sp.]
MIGIRADANKIIASGHVMRCITIAKELIALGESVTFFVADNEGKSLVDSVGKELDHFEVVVLGRAYDHMEDELPVLKKELKARDVNALLVDSYFVTKRYFEAISGICPVAYMDDLGKEPYPVDVLINYSGYYEALGYESLYENMSGHNGLPTKLLLGLKYAPLRRQFYEDELSGGKVVQDINTGDFANATPDTDSNALRILLTAGGADIHGMLLSTLEAARDKGLLASKDAPAKKTVIWEVVVGNLVSDAASIDALSEQYSNINIHHSVTNMASLMRSCDLAVAAAGTMLTECAAVRLPAIFYQVADNQKYNVEFWQKTGGMLFAGDVTGDTGTIDGISHIKAEVVSAICDNVMALVSDTNKLDSMRTALSGLTNGTGAILIAKELVNLPLDQKTICFGKPYNLEGIQ